MTGIIVCLGGAACVWRDLSAAQCILGGRGYDVGACNDAGAVYRGPLALWATLHPEHMKIWQAARGRRDFLSVTHKGGVSRHIDRIVPRQWNGSSGLYLVQVALGMGYQHIVLCGIPMSADAHFFSARPWLPGNDFRRGWRQACEDLRFTSRVRSMSGWTAQMLGQPNDEWLSTTPGETT